MLLTISTTPGGIAASLLLGRLAGLKSPAPGADAASAQRRAPRPVVVDIEAERVESPRLPAAEQRAIAPAFSRTASAAAPGVERYAAPRRPGGSPALLNTPAPRGGLVDLFA